MDKLPDSLQPKLEVLSQYKETVQQKISTQFTAIGAKLGALSQKLAGFAAHARPI